MALRLEQKLTSLDQGVYLIGTTPPKEATDNQKMGEIADKLLGRLAQLEYDGVIVYDIQDESTRIDTPRPFPFARTRDPRDYARVLSERNQRQTLTYQSVGQRDSADFERWLNETHSTYHQTNLVLVGSPSSEGDIRLSLNKAYQLIEQSGLDIKLGGVTIAERHAKKGDEHLRLLDKQAKGCQFFVSQAIYNPQATIDLLSAYSRECKERAVMPARIILTFTPCGSTKTLEFMQWLGISVPEATQYRILDAENPLRESLKICYNNLNQIIEAVENLDLRLGLNIGSLTNRKEEIDAAIQLYRLLKSRLELSLAARAAGI